MSEPAAWERQFAKNPLAWILGGLLAFSVYSHYRTGSAFTRVCETVAALEEGYLDLESNQRFEPSGIDINAIMVKVEKEQALLQANTPEGRAFRWWKHNTDQLRSACSERLSEPDSSE